MNWNRVFEPDVLALMIPILAIIAGIVFTLIRHRERMAMIANGIHPDAPKEDRKKPGVSQQSSS